MTDIDPEAYERILTYLARVQGVGSGPPSVREALFGLGRAASAEKSRDPCRCRWAAPTPLDRASARRTFAASSTE